jgi:GTP pyrophosphokinase
VGDSYKDVESLNDQGLEKLINKLATYYSGDIIIINEAYEFAKSKHEGQLRKSGESYIIHPVEVAFILADLQLDIDTIAAALLHDVVEDTTVSLNEIEKKFGKEIAIMVDGVTKLTRLAYSTKMEQQAENLRKMFLAMSKDIRVLLIKLADRLHNMRTLKSMEVEKQREKARETIEIFAPLAHRLGISKIKWELEDLSLRYIDPDAYYLLVDKVAKRRNEREEYIDNVIRLIKENLSKVGIEGDIQGRPKHFYSIYKKMKNGDKGFDEIFDLMAIRILVDTVKDCYGVLGIIHTIWKPIPGRFKDYIAMPKPNMYQSLHTTVVGPQGDPLEIQIRTYEMHKTAEFGIAAHWKYKEGVNEGEEQLDLKLQWLRELLEWQRDTKNPREFMESLKIDLFTDEVFVFTPKGDVINLPSGSTPLDFAYRIHTDVGHKCIGAKINGRIVPLTYNMNNGDIVEILTSTHSTPSLDWMSIVKTSQARSKIKHWFKREKREESVEKGRELFEKEGKRQGLDVFEHIKEPWFLDIVKRYTYNTTDDLYAGIGFGEITANKIILRMIDEIKKRNKQSTLEEIIKKETKQLKERKNYLGISVKDVDNIMIRLSKCCNPVPGDSIVGYITKGRGVSVHRADCSNIGLLPNQIDRKIEVEWVDAPKTTYPVDIKVWSVDRQGILSDVINIIVDSKIHLSKVNARSSKDGMALMDITLDIAGLDQLKTIMDKIQRVRDVIQVDRTTPH